MQETNSVHAQLLTSYKVQDSLQQVNLHIVSPWDQGQTGIKLGTKHVIYQTLATFMEKENIYVNRLESFIFSM